MTEPNEEEEEKYECCVSHHSLSWASMSRETSKNMYQVSGNDRLQDAERGSTTIEEGECEETLGQRNESAMKYTPPQESPRRRLPGSQASSVQSSPRRFPPGSQASSVQSSPSRFDNLKDKMKSIRRKGGRRYYESQDYQAAAEAGVADHLDGGIQATTGCKVEGIEELMRHTKFTRQELQKMYRGFKNESSAGCFDREMFKKIYAQFFPYGDSSHYADLLFNVFDGDKDGNVSFEEFVCCLSVSLHGSPEDKMKWAFQLYDLNGDGVITREELTTVVHSVHSMMGVPDLVSDESSVQTQVERLFMLMDVNEDGVISEDEFLDGCRKDDIISKSLAMFDSVR